MINYTSICMPKQLRWYHFHIIKKDIEKNKLAAWATLTKSGQGLGKRRLKKKRYKTVTSCWSIGLDILHNTRSFCIKCAVSALCFVVVWYRAIVKISLTHWGRDKMDTISQTTFSSAFSRMKIFEFRFKCHWSLFLRVQLTIFQHWFR